MTAPAGPADPLRDVALFAALPQAARAELAAGAPRRTLAAGDWLFRVGEAADALYVVVSGRLEVVGEDGSTLREIARGGAVGELALLTGEPRSASVRARRDSELLEVAAARFDELLRRDPQVALAAARHLATQLRASRGLSLAGPAPLPTTIAVLAPADWSAALAGELRRFGTIHVLDEASAGDPPGWAGVLDRAEAAGGQVLLLADPGGEEARGGLAGEGGEGGGMSNHGSVDAPAGRSPGGGRGEGGRSPSGSPGAGTPSARSSWPAFCRRQADRVVEVSGRRPDPAHVARRLAGRAVGVVLSGGGARGLAHIGALEAIEERGVVVDRVGGCSMGALIGAQFALGRSPAEIRERCREELVERNPLGDYAVPRVALTRGRRGRAMLERLFGDARLEEMPRDFFCVSSDLVAGTLHVHRAGRAADAVAASVALPGIVPPVRLDDRLLVDGGVLDNLPVAEMAASGEGPVIAVDVTTRFDPATRAGIRETLLRTLTLGSSDTAAAAQAHADAVIEPDVRGFGLLDFSRLDELVERGRAAARSARFDLTKYPLGV